MAEETTWRFILEGEGGEAAPSAVGEPSGVRPDVKQNPRTTRREASEAARGGSGVIATEAQAAKATESNTRDAAKQKVKLAGATREGVEKAAQSLAARAGLGGVARAIIAGAPAAAAVAAVAAVPVIAGAAVAASTNQLAGVSPALASQRARDQAAEIQRSIASAQRNGEVLAEFSASNAQLGRLFRELRDFIAASAAQTATFFLKGTGTQSLLDRLEELRSPGRGPTLLQSFENAPFIDIVPQSEPGHKKQAIGQPEKFSFDADDAARPLLLMQ